MRASTRYHTVPYFYRHDRSAQPATLPPPSIITCQINKDHSFTVILKHPRAYNTGYVTGFNDRDIDLIR